jgi:hypothetical protein
LVLAAGDVTDVVQAVLDPPLAAREGQQPGGIGLVGRQAGDRVDRLDAFDAAHQTAAGDAADLRPAWPGGGEVSRQAAGRLQRAGLDPAMLLADCPRTGKVRRR